MKKLFLLLTFTTLSVPAHAITWNQFWKPFTHERPYYVSDYAPLCTRRVYHKQYIPGNYWTPGYTRTWYETIRVPCYAN
jgi:hypothetical protein